MLCHFKSINAHSRLEHSNLWFEYSKLKILILHISLSLDIGANVSVCTPRHYRPRRRPQATRSWDEVAPVQVSDDHTNYLFHIESNGFQIKSNILKFGLLLENKIWPGWSFSKTKSWICFSYIMTYVLLYIIMYWSFCIANLQKIIILRHWIYILTRN